MPSHGGPHGHYALGGQVADHRHARAVYETMRHVQEQIDDARTGTLLPPRQTRQRLFQTRTYALQGRNGSKEGIEIGRAHLSTGMERFRAGLRDPDRDESRQLITSAGIS